MPAPTAPSSDLVPLELSDAQLEQSIARMKPRHRAWFDAFIHDPRRDATAAAIAAGIGRTRSAQSSLGGRLRKRYLQVIEAWDIRLALASLVSPREVQEQLASIIRNSQEPTRDRLKALELVARILGMLQDKLTVDLDSSSLRRSLGTLSGRLAIQSGGSGGIAELPPPPAQPIVDAQVIESKGELPESVSTHLQKKPSP